MSMASLPKCSRCSEEYPMGVLHTEYDCGRNLKAQLEKAEAKNKEWAELNHILTKDGAKVMAELDELKAEVERLCSYIDYLRLHEGNTLRSKTYEEWKAQQQGEGGE